MRVVFAPDSFKGSIPAARAAAALVEGWRSVRPYDEVVRRPMADGGEGTVDAFAAAVGGAVRMPVRVIGPAGSAVDASWLLLPAAEGSTGTTGVVELASTSGIELLGDERHPLTADSRGFGEAIAAALDHGVDRLILGIGSSASTDVGCGMLAALGARFRFRGAAPATHGAGALGRVEAIDLADLRPLPAGGVTVLTDVRSPLCGPVGTAHVFGPQKGLGPEELAGVDADVRAVARLLPADPDAPGAGAAGGVGFALQAWGATLVPGADAVARLVGLSEAISGAGAVVTGEGSFDAQSDEGKVPDLVRRQAAEHGVPVHLVAGRVHGTATTSGFSAVLSLTDLAGSAAAAMADPARWLRAAGTALAHRVD